MPVIAVENLKYRYPNTESLALDGLSFTVEKGEFIGIVGENGAGKSTLSQALIGLVPQFYKGSLWRPCPDRGPARRDHPHLGTVLQGGPCLSEPLQPAFRRQGQRL